MTILISGGDSFTYGSELNDCTNQQHSNSTWSALLAQQLDMSYACVALPGASNSSITRRVMRACEKAKQWLNELNPKDSSTASYSVLSNVPATDGEVRYTGVRRRRTDDDKSMLDLIEET